MIFILLIMLCSMIGTVILIGLCAPLYATTIPTAPPKYDTPAIVIEESSREGGHFNSTQNGETSRESIVESTTKDNFREWIANRSVTILRAKGMSDEEIKSELLRDFALTKEQVDKILEMQ